MFNNPALPPGELCVPPAGEVTTAAFLSMEVPFRQSESSKVPSWVGRVKFYDKELC